MMMMMMMICHCIGQIDDNDENDNLLFPFQDDSDDKMPLQKCEMYSEIIDMCLLGYPDELRAIE